MGAPLSGPPEPFVVTVTAPPGTYAFHCRIHQGMVGSLTVVAAGSPGVTTSASAEAEATTQAEADVSAGLAAEAAVSKAAVKKNPNGTRTWTLHVGTSDPEGHVAVLDMLPRKVDIKPGDTVVWKALDRNEPHTVTFPGEIAHRRDPHVRGTGREGHTGRPHREPAAEPVRLRVRREAGR